MLSLALATKYSLEQIAYSVVVLTEKEWKSAKDNRKKDSWQSSFPEP
jgi:hypothetical protein